MRKILQIIPAQSAIAVFEEDGKRVEYPIVCWALVEDSDPDDAEWGGPIQSVVGMTILSGSAALSEVDSEESSAEFIEYLTIEKALP